ncbi:MAG: hypothetical protein J2P28_05515 [Actinobacteria bacterium]|nr:hypothetical protein [Actinomycetota bacterium]MBO0830800.1 hypothetical protein [Actinomycetota bacterium]MBO0834964.1 hypothetical protein [Actinomycetota bacterium]
MDSGELDGLIEAVEEELTATGLRGHADPDGNSGSGMAAVIGQPGAARTHAERMVFAGRAAQKMGLPVSPEGIERAKWLSLGLVPELIATGQVRNSASVVGLLSNAQAGALICGRATAV